MASAKALQHAAPAAWRSGPRAVQAQSRKTVSSGLSSVAKIVTGVYGWPDRPGHEIRRYHTLNKYARCTGIFQGGAAARDVSICFYFHGTLSERWKPLATSRFMCMHLHTLLSS